MIHKKTKDGRFTLRLATQADVPQMVEVQITCFPTISKDEMLTAAHFSNHIKIFPEGQLIVIDNDKVIASSSMLRIQFPKLDHTCKEATDNLWITNAHLRDGDWLYQFDMGVLPEYRGLRLSTEMYSAQQEMVKLLGMKGQITVGMTIGYSRYADKYSIEEYCERLRKNEFTDPTVTPQRKAGFQWIKPIYNYVIDPAAGNCSILMVWPLEGVSFQEYIE